MNYTKIDYPEIRSRYAKERGLSFVNFGDRFSALSLAKIWHMLDQEYLGRLPIFYDKVSFWAKDNEPYSIVFQRHELSEDEVNRLTKWCEKLGLKFSIMPEYVWYDRTGITFIEITKDPQRVPAASLLDEIYGKSTPCNYLA